MIRLAGVLLLLILALAVKPAAYGTTTCSPYCANPFSLTVSCPDPFSSAVSCPDPFNPAFSLPARPENSSLCAAVPKIQLTPILTETGSVNPVSSVYGTSSISQYFFVSGTSLTGNLTIAAPLGFELATSLNGVYLPVIILTGGPTRALTKIFIRLAALNNASLTPYSGSVTISSPGAISLYTPAISGLMNPVPFSLKLYDQNKNYGDVLSTYMATGYVPTGINNEVITGAQVTNDAVGTSPTAGAGSPYFESISGAIGTGTFMLSNYAITYIGFSGIILPAPVLLSANNETKVYGSTLITGAGSADFSQQGLQNGETLTSVTLSYAAGNKPTDAVNTYASSVTLSAATGGTYNPSNYTLYYAPADLVITPAPLTIRAKTVTKIYGSAINAVTGSVAYTSQGLVNNETIGSVTLGYGIGSSAFAAAGIYPLSVSVASATGGLFNQANYTITYLPDTLIVQPKPAIITALAISKTYGSLLTGHAGYLSFTVTGLVNKDTISSVSLSFAAGAQPKDPVGDYKLSVMPSAPVSTGFNAANYTLTYIAADLMVTPVPLAISMNAVTKIYGVVLTGGVGSTAFSATGLMNNETIGTASYSVALGSIASSAVGIYKSSVLANHVLGGSFNPLNYSITYTPSDLSISPASLVVKVLPVNKAFGLALQNGLMSSAFTITGLQNNDTATAIIVNYGLGASSTSAAGTYPGSVEGILLSGSSAFSSANYQIFYLPASLIVGTETPLTLLVREPDCADAKGVFTISNFNPAYRYTVSGPGFISQTGAVFRATTGSYSVTALAPQSFSSPASASLLIHPQPPAPLLIITNPAEVKATNTADLTARLVTAKSDPGLVFSYFFDQGGSQILPNPDAINSSGIYFIQGRNSIGCLTSIMPVTVIVDIQPRLIITNPATVNQPATIDLTSPAIVAGSTAGLVYSYYYDAQTSQPLPDASRISIPGYYYIKGVDAGGNIVTGKVLVKINTDIFIPNIFTPNGDGKNDRFVIVRLEEYPGSSLQIYNRWGHMLYQSADYQNIWDGSEQRAGTYYYILSLKNGSSGKIYRGWVQILR